MFAGDPSRKKKKSKKTLTRKRPPIYRLARGERSRSEYVSPAKRKWIAKKIAFLRREGRPRRVAIAIAYRMAGVPRPRGLLTKHLTPTEKRKELRTRRKTARDDWDDWTSAYQTKRKKAEAEEEARHKALGKQIWANIHEERERMKTPEAQRARRKVIAREILRRRKAHHRHAMAKAILKKKRAKARLARMRSRRS